uniref:transposase n=1 Tax=Streptomyces sp. NRRL B-1347 TaxID=1476877 RepID=UPI001F177E09
MKEALCARHAFAGGNLAAGSPILLRAMVKTFADALMSAEVDALCNAAYGQVGDERVNHRNGYRPHEWDTRVGTVELAEAYSARFLGSLSGPSENEQRPVVRELGLPRHKTPERTACCVF